MAVVVAGKIVMTSLHTVIIGQVQENVQEIQRICDPSVLKVVIFADKSIKLSIQHVTLK